MKVGSSPKQPHICKSEPTFGKSLHSCALRRTSPSALQHQQDSQTARQEEGGCNDPEEVGCKDDITDEKESKGDDDASRCCPIEPAHTPGEHKGTNPQQHNAESSDETAPCPKDNAKPVEERRRQSTWIYSGMPDVFWKKRGGA